MTKAQEEAEARRFIEEPLYWARKFGGEHFDPWSGQEEFWRLYGQLLGAKIKRWKGKPLTEAEQALARKFGISIMAGQGVGKGASISLCGLHYLFVLASVRPKVVCTAPAGPQLHSSLYPEFGAWLQRNPLLAQIFEKNSQRIFLKEDTDRGNVSRIEPRTVQPNANPDQQKVVLAGVHATGVLYLIDEASGVPEAVFEPIEGGMTDPLSLAIVIFNPTRRDGFAVETHRKNRDMWIPLHWDGEALRTEKLANPGRFQWFNEDVQLELARKYGRDSDFYRVRVRGKPPEQAADALISYDAVMDACDRRIELSVYDPLNVAADVGGPNAGGDPSVVIPMRGPWVTAIHEYKEKDTVQLGGIIAKHLKDALAALPTDVQHHVGVDRIGIGHGVCAHLERVERVSNLQTIDVSEKAVDERRFHRLRDQIYWELREAFQDAREISLWMDESDYKGRAVRDELIAELTSIKWAEIDGRIKVQGKGPSSGIPHVPPLAVSPNKADALAMAWYLYKHCCSRLPADRQRRRRARVMDRETLVGFRSAGIRVGPR